VSAATPTRPPDWVGNIHHRHDATNVRWRVHIWEPDEEPIEPYTWASIVQVWSMPGSDEPQYVYGATRMQAMFLAWRLVGMLCERVGEFAVVSGLPGPEWADSPEDPGDELPCFATTPVAEQPDLLNRIASLLDITDVDYAPRDTEHGLVLSTRSPDRPDLFSRQDALATALARRLRG
jgi:hypothetical protein